MEGSGTGTIEAGVILLGAELLMVAQALPQSSPSWRGLGATSYLPGLLTGAVLPRRGTRGPPLEAAASCEPNMPHHTSFFIQGH